MKHIGKKKNRLKIIWHCFLEYVFPAECFNCREEGEYLCSACFDKEVLVDKLKCAICNEVENENGICQDCQESTLIDQIIYCLPYTDTVIGKLIESFKYDYIVDIEMILQQFLNRQINRLGFAHLINQAVLVPIPLHKQRLAERGFNQSEGLANGLAGNFNSTVDKSLIFRTKNTSQQAKLTRDERLDNLQGAFRLNMNSQIPQTVVLVDDVLTTGATFSEAAKILKSGGVKKVICLAVCHG